MKKLIDSLKAKRRKQPPKERRPVGERRIAFSRRKASKLAALLLFSVVGLSLLFNVIFFTKYQAIRNSAKAAEREIQAQLQQVQDADLLSSRSVVVFAEDFLRQYVTIPQEEEGRTARQDRLQKYFVSGFDIGSLENISEFKGERTIRSMRFLDHERVNAEQTKVTFIVSYDITEVTVVEETVKKKKKVKEDGKEKEKEVQEVVEKEVPKTVSNTVEIAVPITTDGQGFAVYDKPNMTKRDLKGNVSFEEPELEGDDLTPTERKQLQTFLNDFFTSYGVSDEKLPFMANVDSGLSDQTLQDVTIRDAVRRDGAYEAVVDVQYQHSETSLSSFYTYRLTLERDKNSYFITSLD